MVNEWRTNIWLILEMAIVVFAIWIMLSVTWMTNKGYFQPRGFTPEDVYSVEVKSIKRESPYFLSEYADNYYTDRDELIRRIRENPNVEYVSLHNNALPYNYNFSGNVVSIEGYPDSVGYYGNCRKAQPDIVKILDIKSVTGKTQDQLVEMLKRGEILISYNEQYEEKFGSVKDLIGKKITFFDRETPSKIGDVVDNIRRNDYEPRSEGMILYAYDESKPDWGEIAIKVKPGKGRDFEKDFKNDRSLSHLRNVYLSDIQKLTDMGESIHTPIKVDNRIRIGLTLFLLITIFLGLLGSFWFRVQQRTSEIAIRKTFGATDKDLFRRIIGEGLLLLICGFLFTSALIWPFIGEVVDITGEKWYSFLIIEFITGGLVALGLIISLWYPAWRAMNIEPAVAVKEE